MPIAILKSVRYVSSEQYNHAAMNLISNSRRKWKTKQPGEKYASVIFELSEPQRITGIDIGNEHSAFVKVLVSNIERKWEDFKEILVTCSFMTPLESKNSSNTNRVRCFGQNQLVEAIASEKYDLVQIVCSQPFNKHVHYGLSFIKIHVSEEQYTANNDAVKYVTPKQFLGEQPIKLTVGEEHIDEAVTFKNVYPLRPLGRLNDEESVSKAKKTIKIGQQNKEGLDSDGKTQIDIKKQENKEENIEKHKLGKISINPYKMTPWKIKRNVNDLIPFNKLLSDVVIVISGIQNPDRTCIRNKALKMGAKFKVDWDSTCTHLICAFKNTPKYKQVVEKNGKIVTRKWVEDCYSLKKRVSWRRYAINSYDQDQPESEEEVFENVTKKRSFKVNSIMKVGSENLNKNNDYDRNLNLYDVGSSTKYDMLISSASDTDDEIKKVIANNTVISIVGAKRMSDDIFYWSTEEEDNIN